MVILLKNIGILEGEKKPLLQICKFAKEGALKWKNVRKLIVLIIEDYIKKVRWIVPFIFCSQTTFSPNPTAYPLCKTIV